MHIVMYMVSLVAQSILIYVDLSVENRNICVFDLNRFKFKRAAKMQFGMSRACLIYTYVYVHGLIGGTKYANYRHCE